MKYLHDPIFWTGFVVGWIGYFWITNIIPTIVTAIYNAYKDWKLERLYRKKKKQREEESNKWQQEYEAKREAEVNKYFGVKEGQPRLYGGSKLQAWEHEMLDNLENKQTQKKLIDPKTYTDYDDINDK